MAHHIPQDDIPGARGADVYPDDAAGRVWGNEDRIVGGAGFMYCDLAGGHHFKDNGTTQSVSRNIGASAVLEVIADGFDRAVEEGRAIQERQKIEGMVVDIVQAIQRGQRVVFNDLNCFVHKCTCVQCFITSLVMVLWFISILTK